MDDVTETQQEITEAIQSEIPHELIQAVLGVGASTLGAWCDGTEEMSPAQRKLLRRAFGWIYTQGDEYRPSDAAECLHRARG